MAQTLKEKEGFSVCPYCGSDNIYQDNENWWYCNICGEVWSDDTIFEGREN